ncbi:hypothetical protein NLG97_g5463 [Lecanicillium saksenae]|uniref:Uncharacterized protein n=1 Tax=Lecanicillium saksenae TaxID=468837 RepID=A0ACC1QSD8_9HYPO|nr:hypothetical protein NLG97_g5463 [Lecanicillium saksenae]
MIAAARVFLLSLAATPATAVSRSYQRDEQPNGVTDPGISPYCTYFEEVVNNMYDCPFIMSEWGMSLEEFKAWNPAVGPDCKLIVGHSYCVQVNHGDPLPTTQPTQPSQPTKTTTTTTTSSSKTSSTTTTAKPTVTTGPSGPAPTQDGIIDTCKVFYKATSGDTCQKVVDKYGSFSLADFIRWNPAVGEQCTGLWLGYYYCVGIPGTPTTPTSSTPSSTTSPNGIQTPQPAQPNMVDYCNKFVFVKTGDQCISIASNAGISLEHFIKWNPSVGSDCTGLWANTYACVGAIPDIILATTYNGDCTGAVHNVEQFEHGEGHCVNTDCQVGALQIASAGRCPDGQVRISYWDQPGCAGKWFGYGYGSRGQCRTLWSGGYKFKSLWISCATKESDCVSQNTCSIDTLPDYNLC